LNFIGQDLTIEALSTPQLIQKMSIDSPDDTQSFGGNQVVDDTFARTILNG
jgi:hypothetical protein